MTLDLRDVIGVPGHSAAFDFSPELSQLLSESVRDIQGTPRARGVVRNDAGILTMRAEVEIRLLCVCARCLKEFERDISQTIAVTLSENEATEDDPEYYRIEGLSIDPGEIIVTELILRSEYRELCREDCRGLCERCGADLNLGECDCKPETDPRLAKLAQLLDSE
ncbi:MAG: DUF177 domain-containing protein [Oscillospiraceae bacterium]|nr:DUF177 domain-containing protein [Oscillospiraceae bacterium]